MSVSGLINNSSLWSSAQVCGSSAVTGAAGGSDGNTGAGRAHRHGGGMMKDVMQALSAMGLSPDAASSGAGTAASGSSSADGTSDPSQVQQALHQFMHDLFQTMQSAQSGQPATGSVDSSTTAGAASPYANMESTLQTMIGDLASGTSASSGTLGNLQSDFQNLVSAMGGNSSAAGNSSNSGTGDTSTSAATLQTFLTNLEQEMASHQMTPNAVGNNVSTQA
jgi:hypothetical protein